ncbi:hypothetical protein HDU76_007855, partial [Blyttiomyces sp. JEL0837]
FEPTQSSITVDDKQVDISLWEAAGQEEYLRLLPLALEDADIILICFDVTMRDSYDNVVETWLFEISKICSSTPFILVGLKTDLRSDPWTIQLIAKSQEKMITYEDGMQLANRIGAEAYMECSAKNNDNVDHVFETAVRVAMSQRDDGARRNGERNNSRSEGGQSINHGTRNGHKPQTIKLVCIGDGRCGKSCLLTVFTTGRFPEDFAPEFETTKVPITIDGKQVDLSLWDTYGLEDYDRLLPESLSGADIILICFDIATPDSYANVTEKWIYQVTYYCPDLPIILVGLRTELRFDQATIDHLAKFGQKPATYEDGMQLANTIGAKAYLECSAKENDNVHTIFESAVRVAMSHRDDEARRKASRNNSASEGGKCCTIM